MSDFLDRMKQTAKQDLKTIVLPEGEEDRIIKAADYLLEREIVNLIIVGNKDAILARGKELGLNYLERARFQAMDDENVLKPMVAKLCELRAKKGMTEEQAKKQLMAWFQAYEYCMAVDGEEMTGVGNYNLPILNTDGNKTVFNLWFMDSNPYTDESEGGGYGYVHKDQIDWYERTSNALKAENGGKPVPSLLFQHIVVPEVYNMFTEVSKGTKGAVRGNANHTKQYYVTNPDYIDAGHLNEGPCPANTANDGQLDSWVKQGDILGAIFGHDHVNDYAGTYKGIRLLAAPAVTFYSYGNYRGVRTIDLDESNLTTFQTQVIPADKLMDYTVKNPYIREHGYYEYKSVFIPALCGGIAGLAALTAVIIVLVKVIKKHKAKKQNQ